MEDNIKREKNQRKSISEENFFENPEKFKMITSPYRLNNFDSTILEERAYLQMDNESLKFEYQISNLEESLKVLTAEIFAAIDLCDIDRANRLSDKKEKLEEELDSLVKKYNELGFPSKITGLFGTAFKNKNYGKKNFREKINYFIGKYIFSKLSKRMNFTFNLKYSLKQLSNINRSVDELISLQAPFGDSFDRYEKLTSYISRANEIHGEILDNLKTFEKTKQTQAKKGLDIIQ